MSRPCVVSWSGGKDSTLVLHRLLQAGGSTGPPEASGSMPEIEVVGLLTIFSPETGTSRSHGLSRGLLEAQAELWGLPLHVAEASWEDYEAVFKERVRGLVDKGVEAVAFGDIYLDDHKRWVERVCGEVGADALEPLWGEDTAALAGEVLRLGYRARICTLRADRLSGDWLGRPFDGGFLEAVAARGVDPCGEHGEFHTVVLEGPGMDGRLFVDGARAVRGERHWHWVIDAWHREASAPGGRD